MSKFLCVIFIFNCLAINAQPGKEAWHWQFGNGCVLDFSSGTPVSSSGLMYTQEGCASLSDYNTGQLLLYTNSSFVVNGSNNTVFNGVNLGNNISTQTLIVPKPGSSTICYIVSTDIIGKPHGVRYSVVDLSLRGGQGEVTQIDLPLTPAPATEKVAGVKHCNGTDYWILTHPLNSNVFNAYLVTASGLNTTPVVSTYNWSTGQTTPSISAIKANNYWVKVTNQYNCVAYDTLVVHPETSLFNFIIPNIVTPNGDNINDEIDFSKYQFSSLQLEIYDRWGLRVFESTDPACIWKPNSNDNDGTYYTNLQYRIDCGVDSQSKKINNFITLVR